MDHSRSASGNGDDNVGIPEDLRCKRSDGKQWRCSAMSMPDKTVCEKHYIQAKKRAANSALRASLRKAKRKPSSDDIYSDEKIDEMDTSPISTKGGEYSTSVSSKKYKDRIPKIQSKYSPETPPSRNFSSRNALNLNEDIAQFDDNRKPSYRTSTPSGNDFSRNKALKNFDASEQSDQSTYSSDEDGGLTCHQCQRNDRGRVYWCQKCDRKGYCDNCISKWYPNLSVDEIQKVCPACRGTCNCKACLRVDNLIKARLREISVSDKLKYLHCLLSSILPVIRQIHADQCFEKELETKIYGAKVDIPRAKLHADEQMCCNCCRAFIVDYHRHCANCLCDLCLNCCKDVRQESLRRGPVESFDSHALERSQDGNVMKDGQHLQVKVDRFCDWKANSDGSIPCPPKGSGGCGCTLLTLRRIFKLNWVAKLVKNVEEMVNGCRVYEMGNAQSNGLIDSKLSQVSYREDSDDNFLYCPTSEDIKHDGVGCFQKHWAKGEPVIVKQVCDVASSSDWDPMIVWRGIRETMDEKTKEENRTVKAIDCLTLSEVDIELGQFIKGYTEGRIHESGWPEMLKLKDWPSPSASEEFLMYQRPEFISKLPLLEYIHSKWGVLNVAAKLPHYSLQNDVGPKFCISYGTYEELGKGDSVTNLQTHMCDMVYLLMHTFEVRLKGWQRSKIEKIQKEFSESDGNDSLEGVQRTMADEGGMPSADVAPNKYSKPDDCVRGIDINDGPIMEGQVFGGIEATSDCEMKEVDSGGMDKDSRDTAVDKAPVGAIWDIFRRQDVPKLIEYLRVHFEEFRQPASPKNSEVHPLFDNAIFLSKYHKRKLKADLGIEPWTVEQQQGEAVFIPAGCPFQVRNLQSSVQLGLDFLSPESLKESIRLAEEIRSFPNDHEAKLRMLEVGKMSLYAASSVIREVQKLALDPKVAAELGIDDPNLTALVSENLEKMIRRRQIACV